MATFLYPDVLLKKKYNHMQNKKGNKNSEKSFEECLISVNKQLDQSKVKKWKDKII